MGGSGRLEFTAESRRTRRNAEFFWGDFLGGDGAGFGRLQGGELKTRGAGWLTLGRVGRDGPVVGGSKGRPSVGAFSRWFLEDDGGVEDDWGGRRGAGRFLAAVGGGGLGMVGLGEGAVEGDGPVVGGSKGRPSVGVFSRPFLKTMAAWFGRRGGGGGEGARRRTGGGRQ